MQIFTGCLCVHISVKLPHPPLSVWNHHSRGWWFHTPANVMNLKTERSCFADLNTGQEPEPLWAHLNGCCCNLLHIPEAYFWCTRSLIWLRGSSPAGLASQQEHEVNVCGGRKSADSGESVQVWREQNAFHSRLESRSPPSRLLFGDVGWRGHRPLNFIYIGDDNAAVGMRKPKIGASAAQGGFKWKSKNGNERMPDKYRYDQTSLGVHTWPRCGWN